MCEGEKALLNGGEPLAGASCNHYPRWLLFIVMTFLVRECYGSPKKQEF